MPLDTNATQFSATTLTNINLRLQVHDAGALTTYELRLCELSPTANGMPCSCFIGCVNCQDWDPIHYGYDICLEYCRVSKLRHLSIQEHRISVQCSCYYIYNHWSGHHWYVIENIDDWSIPWHVSTASLVHQRWPSLHEASTARRNRAGGKICCTACSQSIK